MWHHGPVTLRMSVQPGRTGVTEAVSADGLRRAATQVLSSSRRSRYGPVQRHRL